MPYSAGMPPAGYSVGAVSLVDIAPRGSDRSYAALRRRLRITTADGAEVFVVNHVGEVASRIGKAWQANCQTQT